MNKQKKEAIVTCLNTGDNIEENSRMLVKEIIVYSIIIVSIMFIILLLSLFNNGRIMKLSTLTSNTIFGNDGVISSGVYYTMIVFTIIMCIAISFLAYVFYYKKVLFNKGYFKIAYMVYSIYDIVSFILSSVTGLLFFVMVVFTPCNISGPSMEYTFYDSDRVILWSLFYEPDNNDVIVFDSAKYTSSPIGDSFYIKRVVANEDDTIKYNPEDGSFYVNDVLVENISNNQYKNLLISLGLQECEEFVVPKDKLMVLGDNRGNSHDSRSMGFIDESEVIGKVILRFYPFEDFGYPEPDLR